MARETKRPRLGRGLSSLISPSFEEDDPGRQYIGEPHESGAPTDVVASQAAAEDPHSHVENIPPAAIRANRYQPRHAFDEQALAELTESIRLHGVLQPLVVTRLDPPEDQHTHELVAGERRLRAAEMAGLEKVPCLVREASPQEMLELALVENIQRSDLNPVERAVAYRDLMDRFSLTQQQVADRVGQPRATVANYLRLLDLSEKVQNELIAGRLTFGHAKVLASLAGNAARQDRLAQRVISRGLSVRKLEELVKQDKGEGAAEPDSDKQGQSSRPAYIVDLERQLAEAVGTRVSIRPGRRPHTGRVVIEYYSLEDFDRIVETFGLVIDS
jgi:ParB family chromosome partitioning protein